MLGCKGDRMKVTTKTVGIRMIFNIRLTTVPKYAFFLEITIMDLVPVGSSNSENRGYNSLVLVLRHAYLLDSNL